MMLDEFITLRVVLALAGLLVLGDVLLAAIVWLTIRILI